MSDLISRQAAIDALEREKTYCTAYRDGYSPTNPFEKYNEGLADGVKALKNLPSAQPEIIHCRECEYGSQDDVGRWYCIDFGCQVGGEDGSGFCSDGERREDG